MSLFWRRLKGKWAEIYVAALFHYLLLLMGAKIQENVQVLELPRWPLHNKLLKGGHAKIHPRLGQMVWRQQGKEGCWKGTDKKLSSLRHSPHPRSTAGSHQGPILL